MAHLADCPGTGIIDMIYDVSDIWLYLKQLSFGVPIFLIYGVLLYALWEQSFKVKVIATLLCSPWLASPYITSKAYFSDWADLKDGNYAVVVGTLNLIQHLEGERALSIKVGKKWFRGKTYGIEVNFTDIEEKLHIDQELIVYYSKTTNNILKIEAGKLVNKTNN